MDYRVAENFKWAHKGVSIMDYNKGDLVINPDDDLLRVGVEEGWLIAANVPPPQQVIQEEDSGNRADEIKPDVPAVAPAAEEEKGPVKRGKKSAPENKAVDGAPEKK